MADVLIERIIQTSWRQTHFTDANIIFFFVSFLRRKFIGPQEAITIFQSEICMHINPISFLFIVSKLSTFVFADVPRDELTN